MMEWDESSSKSSISTYLALEVEALGGRRGASTWENLTFFREMLSFPSSVVLRFFALASGSLSTSFPFPFCFGGPTFT